MYFMTIEDLYQWAKENGREKANIRIQYRDDGGYYYGYNDMIALEYDESENCITL